MAATGSTAEHDRDPQFDRGARRPPAPVAAGAPVGACRQTEPAARSPRRRRLGDPARGRAGRARRLHRPRSGTARPARPGRGIRRRRHRSHRRRSGSRRCRRARPHRSCGRTTTACARSPARSAAGRRHRFRRPTPTSSATISTRGSSDSACRPRPSPTDAASSASSGLWRRSSATTRRCSCIRARHRGTRRASSTGSSPSWWSPLTAYATQMHAAWHLWLALGRHAHPDLRVCFALLAGLAPLHAERRVARGGPEDTPNETLFYDTSSYGSRAIAQVAQVVGPGALVHGSDRPVVDPPNAVVDPDATVTTRGNPARLLGWTEAS